ncbi:MAG: TIGR03905 family TSCPD domain-containing protein [Spirochaetaceae bacterium]|jgi:uncharacterized protein (TIGR03905 family)|nr:TIGR03905 family TSCPD domain-containing protein [Spirochaetaceae bacterium]
MYEFRTKGVCASRIFFDITDGKVHDVVFENGCNGNLKAIGQLVEGMGTDELVKKLRGISCGSKPTSCGDQLANAVELAVRGNVS